MPFQNKRKREPKIRRVLRENLRNRRIELKMTAKRLGLLLGVKPQWIHALESPRGRAIPGLIFLERLAVELGTTPADLLTPGRFSGVVGLRDDLRGKL